MALDANGRFVAGLAPAWAKDAMAASVPTRFLIDGLTVTQVVDHLEGDFTYPVVADPWLGADLFGYTGYNRRGLYEDEFVVSAKMSAWGWYWYRTGGGQAILRTAGWSELLAKRSAVDDKATLRHQYDCHVTFGYAVWLAGLHWDLEKARSNKTDWLSSALTHKCNWG